MSPLPKRHYVLAVVCYLLIPVAVFGGADLFRLIDPELARGHADYAGDYRLLALARRGVLMATAALTLVLWTAVCYLVLKARQRSLGWLLLSAAGPFGFAVIAMLGDRAPAPGDLYQQFLRTLKVHWRVALETAVLVAVWFLAGESVALKRELMIRYESFITGTPVAAIVAEQSASSGMWAFGEGLQAAYLVVLLYLLWPIIFNLAGKFFSPRANPTHIDSSHSSG